jgi:hypothetical protein
VGLFSQTKQRPRQARFGRPGVDSGLVASARTVNRSTAPALRRLSQPWQLRALGYYDTVGECWYPAQFYARSLQKVRFFPAILDERGDPQEVDSGPLLDLFERVQDPGGGRSELTGAYGRLMFLTGDGYLTVTEDGDSNEAWEFLSPAELRVNAEDGGRLTYRRLRAPGLNPEELEEAPDESFEPLAGNEAWVARLYRRHPMYSEWADSPVKAVLDLYELLTWLTNAAAAEGKSRAANRGLFYVPDELTLAALDAEVNDEDPEQDIFLQEFTEGLMAAIRDPTSASAMTPFVLRGPALLPGATNTTTMKDALGWMPLGPDASYKEADMWDKTINRIGMALDLPKEFVTGTGDVNHWGGWLLDEQGFRQHVAPMAQKLCDDLGSAYLRPAALNEGIDNADRVTVGYDPAEAVNHPDETSTAKDLHDRLVLSDEALRNVAGFTDDDAPDQEEYDRRALILLHQVPPELESAQPQGETAPQDGGRGADTTEAPPPPPGQSPNGNGNTPAAAPAGAGIVGAAEMMVERARRLAGSRLRSRSQSCGECGDRIDGTPAALVAATLGEDTVRTIIKGHVTEPALVAGASEEFVCTLGRWGVTDAHAAELARLVEQHALWTLYEQQPPPLPAGFTTAAQKALL